MESSRSFELLCIVLLGLGQMCIMTGYDTQSFVAESVLHSVNQQEPTRIDAFAGYYGQATCYAAYMISCLFAPSILSVLTPKWTLFLGSVCYTLYHMGFLYINNYYYYASCAVMGAGFALYYAGHGAYLTSHSTRKTIEQNSAIAWTIACLCMILGGGILAAIFSFNKSAVVDFASSTNTTEKLTSHAYRQFSDPEIRMMYGAFAAVTFCANLIFVFTPSRETADCIEGMHTKLKTSFRGEMGLVRDIFIDKRMIELSPLFVHLGLYTSFWVSIYPTSLVFAKTLSSHVYLPAFYSMAVGLGETVMGLIISTMSRRIPNFGLEPTMYICFGLTTVILTAVLASVPQWATVRLTDEPSWIIQPSAVLSVFIAFIMGMADSCVNNVRNVICALALPEKRSQAFAISKFYQALAGAVLMFSSPFLSVSHYAALLFFTLSLSTVCFVHIARRTKRVECSASQRTGAVSSTLNASVQKF